MRVLISGAGGLVGRALRASLAHEGHTLARLVRTRPRAPDEFRWDPRGGILDPAALASCDAVVHLAGASIAAGRWTRSRREEILESRVRGTRLLAEGIARASPGPRVLVCASAVGYYGDRGDQVLDERSDAGGGFLADVVRAWEGAARAAADAGTRVVRLRTGVVLDRRGGALPRLALPFRLGLGGRLGSGRQWVSWITLDDLTRVVHRVLTDDLAGAVNAVSPGAVTQAGLARALAAALARPAWLAMPAWALRALLGEMGRELLLYSQRVIPARLLAVGHAFAHPGIEGALHHVLRPAAARRSA